MDCIDCHNRPTHLFQNPSRAIDRILEENDALRRLPFFKRTAVEAISRDYASHADGIRQVRDVLAARYRTDYQELWQADPDLVEEGAAAAAGVYGRTVFPAMNTDWGTHPNNIGHEEAPGCWRCHDSEMATADGSHVIPMDCENCHAILVEDAAERPDLASLAPTS
jgi:hypothetical protein